MTIDAMGCQKTIAKQVIESDAHYVLAVKDNQPALNAELEAFFEEVIKQPKVEEKLSYQVEEDQSHGRIEKRFTWTTSDLGWMKEKSKWAGLKSIGMVASERTIKGGKTTFETRMYITSLPSDAEMLAKAVRTHWQVENNLHWTLDIAFRENECRVRKGYGAQNFATLRHIALNLIKKETTAKVGIKTRAATNSPPELKADFPMNRLKILNCCCAP